MREPKPPRTRPRLRPCSRVINSRMALASPCRLTPITMPSSVHCILLLSFRGASETSEPGIHTPRIREKHGDWGYGFRVRPFGPSRNDSILFLRKLQPHGPVALRVVAPALAHLDEQEQVYFVLDDPGDFAPRRFADRLEGLPAFADHDLALALALHINRLLDPHIATPQLLPLLGLDRGMVRQLLVQPLEQLLA